MLGRVSEAPEEGVMQDDTSSAALTDIGCEREINEDRYAVIDSPNGKAWIVCDGMGGSLGGELAAQLAIDAIKRQLQILDTRDLADVIKFAIEEANRVIVLRRQNPAFSKMGTTVVSVLLRGHELVLIHAGDSRAYLVRGEKIEQLTVDHTYVQELVEKGAISKNEALTHPQAHVLTKCLGAEPSLDLEVKKFFVWPPKDKSEEGDKIVLCSDGLYSLVTESEISKVISSNDSLQDSCMELVDMAKKRGGFDNITVAIFPISGRLKDEKPLVNPKVDKKLKAKPGISLSSNNLQVGVPRGQQSSSPMFLAQKLAIMLALFIAGAVFVLILLLVNG